MSANYSDYYRQRLLDQDLRYKKLIHDSILGKRKYTNAFGYDNDYESVQNVDELTSENWKDSCNENLFNR
jgi:hypothetical protein